MRVHVSVLIVLGYLAVQGCGSGGSTPSSGAGNGATTSTSGGTAGGSRGAGSSSNATGIGGGATSVSPGTGSSGGGTETGGAGTSGGGTETGGAGSSGGSTDSGGGTVSNSTGTGGAGSGNDGGSAGSSTPVGVGDGGTGATSTGAACPADSNLPKEPTIPPACTTLQAAQSVAPNGVPSESSLDTSRIQSALNSCGSGHAVKLTVSGSNNAFVTGPLSLPSGVTLWVDAKTTLFGSRNASLYGGGSSPLISVSGSNSGIVGDGVIDGQGGEPKLGSTQSWWDASDALRSSNGSAPNPALIDVKGASNFTMYRITLHNSPKFHVKLAASGFMVWGVTLFTPSKTTNSMGAPLTPYNARNTDGIDPGESASNGYIVCSKISVGDDEIAIKGASGVKNLTIAHNHFGSGHGMSIGSEVNGGVSGINVYDLTIDGSLRPTGGSPPVDVNGLRIKSDSSRGGLVNNITYSNVCVRDVDNPIVLNPNYSTNSGSSIPQFTNVTIKDFHASSSTVTQVVTLDGYDSGHRTSVTLDNVVVDGITASNINAQYADITLGPGAVNFVPPASSSVVVTNKVSGTAPPIDCSTRWVTF